jgi:hypothetical protein
MIELRGIELELPAGWAQVTKGPLTVLGPTKYKGRAIEVVSAAAMPEPTADAFVKALGQGFTFDAKAVKAVDLAGTKVVAGVGKATAKKLTMDVDVLAIPVGSGATYIVSFTAADSDPAVRDASRAILKSAHVAGPKLTVSYTAPTAKTVTGPPQAFVDGFKKLIPALDARFVMPRPLPVSFVQCDKVNAFYSPPKHTLTMCHELFDHFVTVFTKAGLDKAEVTKAASGAFAFVFFHEFGHALVGELELAITAKGEDAADELATLFVSYIGKDSTEIARYGAMELSIEGAMSGQKYDFLDEHSVDEQRMGSIVCLLYGFNQTEFGPIAQKLKFRPDRLGKCVRDFKARDKAWGQLLKPHVRPKKS